MAEKIFDFQFPICLFFVHRYYLPKAYLGPRKTSLIDTLKTPSSMFDQVLDTCLLAVTCIKILHLQLAAKQVYLSLHIVPNSLSICPLISFHTA